MLPTPGKIFGRIKLCKIWPFENKFRHISTFCFVTDTCIHTGTLFSNYKNSSPTKKSRRKTVKKHIVVNTCYIPFDCIERTRYSGKLNTNSAVDFLGRKKHTKKTIQLQFCGKYFFGLPALLTKRLSLHLPVNLNFLYNGS
jgi:hypothetical protein